MKWFELLNGGFEGLFITDKEKYFSQSLFQGITDLFKLSPCKILEWKQTPWQSDPGFGNL